MRTEEEIMHLCADYQRRLDEAAAALDQARRSAIPMPEQELLLLALAAKLELLFWVLEIELANPEALADPTRFYN